MRIYDSIALRIIISLTVTLLLSILFLKTGLLYKMEIAIKRFKSNDKQEYYFDLNNDNKTERIYKFLSGQNRTSFIVYDNGDKLLDQYNVAGRIVNRSKIFTGDYNKDDLDEVYLFTYIGDSLFLNVIDPYNRNKPYIARAYIKGCRLFDGEAAYRITGSALEDVNGDGFSEFYFSIGAGFSLSPRAVYYYDINNDSIAVSPLAGTNPNYFLFSEDVDADGYIELWGLVSAFNNYNEIQVPYKDNSSWLMLFSHELEFEFEPVEFKGFASKTRIRIIEKNGENMLAVLHSYNGDCDTIKAGLYIFNVEGERICETGFPEDRRIEFSNYYVYNEKIYLHNIDGSVYIYNNNLKLIGQKEKSWMTGNLIGPCNLSGGEERQLIFVDPLGSIMITDLSLKPLAGFNFGEEMKVLNTPVYVSNRIVPEGFHLKTSHYDYLISYVKNPSRILNFVYAFLIFISLYFFIWFIQQLQLKQEAKKKEIENRLKTLQLKSVKNQMNPHFIFNSLNSISAMYLQKDISRADSFLTSFSKMIRKVVDSSDQPIVSLKEEMDFVKNYLELEQIRYGKCFVFEIFLPEDCQTIMLPSMSIHLFVENAVKHAFPGRKNDIRINVNVSCSENNVLVRISDNGKGFENREIDDGQRKGKGLQMVDEIFTAYTEITQRKINYSISNISDSGEGDGRGTLVEITIEK